MTPILRAEAEEDDLSFSYCEFDERGFAGYFFGNIPAVKTNFHIVILAIIVISFLPVVFEFLRARKAEAC